MSEWIYPKELAEGRVDGFPKISLSTQVEARRHRKITYTKTGKHVVYKREWIEEWLNNNIRNAKPKVG
jgi:hypothetical protein